MLTHSLVEFDFRRNIRGLSIGYYGKEKVKFADETHRKEKLVSAGEQGSSGSSSQAVSHQAS
jgi:hypothetical protein